MADIGPLQAIVFVIVYKRQWRMMSDNRQWAMDCGARCYRFLEYQNYRGVACPVVCTRSPIVQFITSLIVNGLGLVVFHVDEITSYIIDIMIRFIMFEVWIGVGMRAESEMEIARGICSRTWFGSEKTETVNESGTEIESRIEIRIDTGIS
ncbi:hypothetical protein EVAR_23461_1 [Eumeta japonica]|uniref:Uncharacterized protein n=1 Tax=Eumeta variegata TaxID=151549 RepID=A0A4C1UKL6_EUMVA|nr:hypothetical protein EVAR_23461_1 [Eumeta japonica]